MVSSFYNFLQQQSAFQDYQSERRAWRRMTTVAFDSSSSDERSMSELGVPWVYFRPFSFKSLLILLVVRWYWANWGVIDLGDTWRWSFKRDRDDIGESRVLDVSSQSLSDPCSQNQQLTMACYWSPFPNHSSPARGDTLFL